ncbi:MAG TPA: ABC transporter substrate-binding protein [Stellaceae bacterium]|nr:ABC transporter substrate-binding protein [Stellaceae bacterium]
MGPSLSRGAGEGLTRRAALVLLAGVALPSALAAQAQRAGQMRRIGWLSFDSVRSDWIDAFRDGLRDLGYVEGENVAIEARFAEGAFDRLPALAAELVQRRVEVIVTYGDAGVRAARQATTTIPIVVAVTGDLIGPGHVASLAHPGGNVTGQVDMSEEVSTKRLQVLTEAVAIASRVAVLWNRTNAVKAAEFRALQAAGQTLKIAIRSFGIAAAADLESAFAGIGREQADALIVLEDALTSANQKSIVERTASLAIPAMYHGADWVRDGSLLSYGADELAMFRHAAVYVDKILKGAAAADLPVEQAAKFALVINLRTAAGLKLTLPPTLLARADEVIE